MIQYLYRLLIALVMADLLVMTLGWQAKGQAADPSSNDIEQIFEQMSVEERVGQLFLVTFEGNGVGPKVQELIRDYKVGGLIIDAATQNFNNFDKEVPASVQVAELTNALQSFAWESNRKENSSGQPYFIPLLVTIDHEGNGPNFVRIRSGMTTIPSQLTIGATWSEKNAEDVGQIVGQELAAIGVNMVLGPVVDVVDDPTATWRGNMGLRVFGGNPQWVGRLGRAYIRGVHRGSDGRVATVAKHFPGHGDSNRNPDGEVAVLGHTLNDLRKIDLIPFFTVTETRENDNLGVTDALMSSHIDYKRPVRGPVSLTREDGIGSVTKLLNESEFADWRESGVVVVDALGVPAVKKHYDPDLETFQHEMVAVNALLAGNDLLTLASYSLNGDFNTSLRNTKETISFFQEEYQKDPNSSFRKRVDEAALKILKLKFRLYPELSLAQVSVDEAQVPELTGKGDAIMRRIAREAITNLHPEPSRLSSPPRPTDQILVATHNWNVRDCSECPWLTPLPVDALERHMIEREQLNPNRIDSIPFYRTPEREAGLIDFLNGDTSPEETERIQQLIDNADWIIFAMLDLDWGPGSTYDPQTSQFQEANTLKTFLGWYKGDAKLVAVTFGTPPFNLDSTDIDKLTAYYAAYSKVEPLPEYAVRAIFQKLQPHRAAPISVGGTGYDLARQVRPDPERTAAIKMVETREAILQPGRVITLETTLIYDYNGHIVPDGTEVTWWGRYSAGYLIEPLETNSTRDGIARAIFPLNEPGNITFSANSGPAYLRELTLEVAEISSPTNTPSPTESPATTAIHTPSSTASPTAIAINVPVATASPVSIPINIPVDRPASVPFFQTPAGGATIGAIATIIAAIVAALISRNSLSAIGTKAGYRRRLNILRNNLNHLKEQEAFHDPADIPVALADEIRSIEEKIAELEESLRDN